MNIIGIRYLVSQDNILNNFCRHIFQESCDPYFKLLKALSKANLIYHGSLIIEEISWGNKRGYRRAGPLHHGVLTKDEGRTRAQDAARWRGLAACDAGAACKILQQNHRHLRQGHNHFLQIQQQGI